MFIITCLLMEYIHVNCTNDSSTPSKEKQINFAALHNIVGKMLNVCLKCYSFIFIIVNPCEQCDHKIILHILMVNVLLHTMILKDKCNEKLEL
jgi:hypothetical protein